MKIYKLSGQMDIYNTIRKKMPPQTKVMDSGNTKPNMRNIGGDFDTELPDLDTLKDEAIVATDLKGHTLGNWEDSTLGGQRISVNHCLVCDKAVMVNDRPKPNQLDISGEAVSTICGEGEENV